jgi:NAD(P)H-flavin reductase
MKETPMNKILKKEQLAPEVVRFRIETPKIAAKRKAGQFIICRSTDTAERIPLTIANANAKEGWIELIFQIVGAGTMILSNLNEGDSIYDLVGPLGKPTHVENFGNCLCIGGGVGIAPLYPIVCALKDAGNHVTTIIGARSENILILENEMKEKSSELHVATDDGSYGYHGFVSDVFNNLIAEGKTFDLAMVIGPAIMMKVTTALTIKEGIKTYASLNPIMIDGTGMCGGCRVSVHGKTLFGCVDGPEFDASGIDWDLLINRLNSYRDFEIKAKEEQCRLAGA